MLVYLRPNSYHQSAHTTIAAHTVTPLSLLPHTVTVAGCLSTSVVGCSLSPSIAVEVTAFILPVKEEAETASVIAVGGGGEWGSSHISDCEESQVVYTVVCLR